MNFICESLNPLTHSSSILILHNVVIVKDDDDTLTHLNTHTQMLYLFWMSFMLNFIIIYWYKRIFVICNDKNCLCVEFFFNLFFVFFLFFLELVNVRLWSCKSFLLRYFFFWNDKYKIFSTKKYSHFFHPYSAVF